jgi:hypothetical protein
MALLILAILAGLGYYLYTQSQTTSSAPAPSLTPSPDTAAFTSSPSAAPAAPVVDPKQNVFAKGKALQVAEKDIGPSVPVDYGPTGVDTTKPVAYTISMFINPEKVPTGWRNLFTRGGFSEKVPTGWLNLFTRGLHFTAGHPAIFLSPDSTNIHFRHATDNVPNHGIYRTAEAIALGQYTHVACVNDGATMSVYINGVKDANTATIDPSHRCQWGTDDTTHSSQPPENGDNGYLKIKELYIFPVALSAEDIKTLAGSSAPSTTGTTGTTGTPPPKIIAIGAGSDSFVYIKTGTTASPWVKIPGSDGVKSVSQSALDGSLLGVSTNKKPLSKASLDPATHWQPITTGEAQNDDYEDLFQKADGSFVWRGTDSKIYTHDSSWKRSARGTWCCVSGMSLSQDGASLLGTGTDGKEIWKKPHNSTTQNDRDWSGNGGVRISSSVDPHVIGIAEMTDGSFLCTGRDDKKTYTMSSAVGKPQATSDTVEMLTVSKWDATKGVQYQPPASTTSTYAPEPITSSAYDYLGIIG